MKIPSSIKVCNQLFYTGSAYFIGLRLPKCISIKKWEIKSLPGKDAVMLPQVVENWWFRIQCSQWRLSWSTYSCSATFESSSSTTTVTNYQPTRSYIPQGRNLQQQRFESLEYHNSIPPVPTGRQVRLLLSLKIVRVSADKSLARPGRKQATATKLGIYSTHCPWSSINLLARCSKFCKPFKKKIRRLFIQPGLRGSNGPGRRTKNGELSIVFFSPGNRP